MTTKIAVIGTGNVGGNLGARLSNAGFPVKFGVRDDKDTPALLARSAKDASAASPAAAAEWADVVFLAVPALAAADLARSLSLAGKIVVDCTNPLTWQDGPVWAPPKEGSIAAAIAAAAPTARVVKGFNQFGAELHADPKTAAGPAPVFFAGDDAAANKLVGEIATTAGFRAVDAGPLRNAAVLENVAMLWIHLATVGGHGRNFAFTMAGRAP
jgi:NADPH-dependent F420 reductase